MRWRLIGLVVAFATLASCSTGPDVPTLLVDDGCVFDGPERVTEGTTRLTLRRTGLGDYGAAMVRFAEGHDATELRHHLETNEDWEDRPDWVTVRYSLQVSDDRATNPTGETVLMSLEPGEHAVVCINYSDHRAGVAGVVDVLSADS